MREGHGRALSALSTRLTIPARWVATIAALGMGDTIAKMGQQREAASSEAGTSSGEDASVVRGIADELVRCRTDGTYHHPRATLVQPAVMEAVFPTKSG